MIEEDLEKGLLSFGRGFTVLEEEVSEELAAELKQAKRALEKVCVCVCGVFLQGLRGGREYR